MNPNTRLRAIGFPQRLKDREKPDKDGTTKRQAEPGETFLAKDHDDPDLALDFGLVEVVNEKEDK